MEKSKKMSDDVQVLDKTGSSTAHHRRPFLYKFSATFQSALRSDRKHRAGPRTTQAFSLDHSELVIGSRILHDRGNGTIKHKIDLRLHSEE